MLSQAIDSFGGYAKGGEIVTDLLREERVQHTERGGLQGVTVQDQR